MPVRSVTRAVERRHRLQVLRRGRLRRSSPASSEGRPAAPAQHQLRRSQPCGGVLIAASFSTVKFGFTLCLNSIAVRLVGNERTVVL